MAADRASIQAFLDAAGDVWKTNDGAAFAELFTEDGSLVNPFGERADGRAAVGAMYSDYFAGMLGGTSTTTTVQHVRAVGDDHALVDADQAVTGPDGQVVLALHFLALLRCKGDTWQFADGRPYALAQPPG